MSSTPHILANGNLTQNWSNTGQITANDNWSNVAGIVGYLGDVDAGSPTNVNPTTLTGANLGAVDVIANQTTPDTATAGGVAEFQITDPTIALNGSGTADAPSLVLYLDASNREDVRLQFDARDIDASGDNANQQLAVQYRLGNSGSWTNVPGGYDADVTTANSATEVTHFDLQLPSEVNGRADLQVRILTTNAGGNDEWVGIDNIDVSSEPAGPAVTSVSIGDVTISEGDAGTQVMTFTVTCSDNSSDFTVDYGTANGTATAGSDYAAAAGTLNFTVGGPLTQTVSVTINGDADGETDEAFSVNLSNATNGVSISDASATGTIANDDLTITKISAIQGTGATNTMNGQTVTVEAIVVGDFQNGDGDNARNLNGFYLQEEITDSDGNVLTSEGIFVFAGPGMSLNVGDKVRVTGSLTENFGMTQLNASAITVVEAGAVADVNTMAAVIDLPTAGTTLNQEGQYQPDLEAYEGMLVTIPQTLTVTEQFDLDRFNEIKLYAGEEPGDRPAQFTHDNAPDQAGYQQHLEEVGSRTITYDDGLNSQNLPIGNLDGFDPNDNPGTAPAYTTENAPRMGDTVTGLTGVLDYQWAGNSSSGSTWRVRSIEDGANEFESVNERPETPPDVGGNIQVGSFNVLNFFKTLNTINEPTNGPDNPADNTAIGLDPRGANNADEFARQAEKLVNVLCEMDADILGLIEIENDFLPGSAGNALEYLVNAMNAKLGSNVYAWVDPGQQFVGSDAISVACIYKPSEVRIAPGTTIEILNDDDLPQELIDRSTVGGVFDGLNTSRNVLTVTFEDLDTGGEFTAAINHLKSKSGSGTGTDADQLDGQGAWQNQRELAAEALSEWLATKPTGTADDDVMLLGDFNAYFKEDAVGILEDAGYENLQQRLDDPYSYVFDGQTGSLDYIFANGSLAEQVTGVAEWHINADEADALDYNTDFGRDPNIFDADSLTRVSDHDPILVGLNLQEETPVSNYKLQILHASDFEAGLKAVDRAGNFAAIVDYLEDTHENSITLSSGDNFLPSPFFNAGSDASLKEAYETALEDYYNLAPGTLNITPGFGTADISMLNIIGIEASSIGNHEFDAGTNPFAAIIRQTGTYPGAQFPYLAANLDFSGDPNLAGLYGSTIQNAENYQGFPPAAGIGQKIAPATIINENGERIGIVGATTQIVQSISSTGGVEVIGDNVDDMAALAAILQPTIDALIAQGIDKIVVVSHLQQLALEKALAPLLHGVDVILAGGSHTLMADSEDVSRGLHAGDEPVETYPFVTTNADGKSVVIASTSGEYSYVGRLVVEFDENGDIVTSSIDPNESGAYATTDEVVDELYENNTTVDVDNDGDIDANDADAFASGSRGDLVNDIAQAVGGVIDAQDGNIFGKTDVYLEGRRNEVRTEETNLGNLSADANLWYAQKADATVVISIKNGGGVRDSIGQVEAVGGTSTELPPAENPDVGKEEGDISQLDIANSLRFNNALSLVTVTATQLLQVLEHAVAATTATATPGQFAQVGGISYSFDKDLPAGNRIMSAALIDENGDAILKLVENGELVVDPSQAFRLVTLSFLLTGGDGYPFASFIAANPAFANVVNLNPALVPDAGQDANFATEGTEQDALAEYLSEFHSETAYNDLDTDRTGDERIQNLDFRNDTVFEGLPVTGTDGDDEIIGTPDADVIDAGEGDDTVEARAGYDDVEGGEGDDVIDGEEGDDVLKGGEGDDTLIGGADNDTLKGGEGDDDLDGGDGVDTADYSDDESGVTVDLEAGEAEGDDAGTDALTDIENVKGGLGDDTLIGNDAANVLDGGEGNDTIVADAGDTAIGGEGDDEIEASAENGGPASVDGGEGDDTIRLTATSAATIAALGAATGVETLLVEEGTWSVAASDYSSVTIEDGAKVTSTIALNNDDLLSVETGGILNAATAISWSGGGDAVIDNAGRIESSSRVLNTVAGATGSLTFNNEGTVVGAITPQGAGHADAAITINNSGTIESAVNGRVLDFRNFDANGASAVVNNLAGGVIRKIGGDDADVIRPGVDGVVNNWGTITVDVAGVDAIDFQGDTGGKVNNYAGGLIQGTKHAVTGERAVTIVNSGTMIGANGSAVNIDNDGSEAEKVFITNNATGVMEGRSAETSDSDGDAIDIDGLTQILNYGRIAGLGAEGYHDGEPNVSEGIAIGGGTILNYGANAVIYGYGRAIQVDNSSNANALGKTFINNDGLIQGDGHGPEGVDPQDAAEFDLRGNEAVNLVGDYADEFLNQSTGRVIGGVSMGGGNDHLQSLGSFIATGGSAIDMGAGNDTVYFYTGTTVQGKVLLGSGNDLLLSTADYGFDIDAGDGNDEMYISGYTGGNDTLKGGAGNDRIYAGLGNDVIDGGADNDTIAGEAGDDVMNGGAGDDIILAGLGNDTIDGGEGFDTLDLSGATGPVNVNFGAGTVSGAGLGSDTFINIENLLFGAGNDTVTGGNGDDGFDGGAGDDVLKGGAGDDTLAGGEGNDNIDGGSGDDIVNGGTGDDIVKAGSGDDEVLGGEGDDEIDAGSGDDSVVAGAGDDLIDGGSGDDVIEGGLGDDDMAGGSGHDVFVFASGFGNDTISDFKTTGSSSDILEFDADIFADFASAIAAADQVGKNVVFTFDADHTITLEGVQLASLAADDFRFV